MDSFNLADMFVTFLALLGPQKVLLSFARMGQTLDVRAIRLVAVSSSVCAAVVGVACALAAPWLATFFHIGTASLELAAGAVFFVYAVSVVLGLHFDSALDGAEDAGGPGVPGVPGVPGFPGGSGSSGSSGGYGGSGGSGDDPGKTAATHSLTNGFRETLLPFVVSPLGVAAALEESLTADGWGGRWTVAAAFVAVALVDLVCAWVFAPLLRRAHTIALEVLSRLLGILLTAVGVQIFLMGLASLGVHTLEGHLRHPPLQPRPSTSF